MIAWRPPAPFVCRTSSSSGMSSEDQQRAQHVDLAIRDHARLPDQLPVEQRERALLAPSTRRRRAPSSRASMPFTRAMVAGSPVATCSPSTARICVV